MLAGPQTPTRRLWRDRPASHRGGLGLCAHDTRFAEHDVIEHIAGLATGGGFPRQDHWSRPTVPRLRSRSPSRAEDDGGVGTGALVSRPPRPRGRGPPPPPRRTRRPPGRPNCRRGRRHPAAPSPTAGRSSPSPPQPKRWSNSVRRGFRPHDRQCRIDLTNSPFPAGTVVVVLDGISQTSTRDAHIVLSAVDACPGGQVWVLGDPKQVPGVKAGGIAAEIDTRATLGSIPAAQLTMNRRQVSTSRTAAPSGRDPETRCHHRALARRN